MASNDGRVASDINRLYWTTERSVGDIAEEVGVSRRALYDAIQPSGTGVACPECGVELAFRNRTARDAREAECPGCGLERDLTQEELAPPPEPDGAERGSPTRAERLAPGVALGGAALAGLVLGALAGWLASRD